MWAILSGSSQRSLELARRIEAANPVNLGIALQANIVDPMAMDSGNVPQGSCSRTFETDLGSAACFFDFWTGVVELWRMDNLVYLIHPPPERETGTFWAPLIFKLAGQIMKEVLTETEPHRPLIFHLMQAAEVARIPDHQLYAFSEVTRYTKLRRSLDLGGSVDRSTTYEEFMTLRQKLPSPELRIFEDKIKLRRELLQPAGVLHTPTIYMSNTNPYFLEHREPFHFRGQTNAYDRKRGSRSCA
eukprot:TRINITY_DN64933_c0_g1_i1.p1 TRINITY_DN64933_c0_g1~~TRINITY_DN64933_c0_g1_i1.p1  ORF type:complete len:262 (-),score=31.97 TRINITY_DN64933_c0_g1_i1:258-989(-)